MPSFILTPRGKRIVKLVNKLSDIALEILDVAKDGAVDDSELIRTFGMSHKEANELLMFLASRGLIRRTEYSRESPAPSRQWKCSRCGNTEYVLYGSPAFPLCESCFKKGASQPPIIESRDEVIRLET